MQVESVVDNLGYARLVGQVEPSPAVTVLQLLALPDVLGWRIRDKPAVRAPEVQGAMCAPFDPVAALVQEAVMVGAELDEVCEVRASATRPMVDVVGMEEAPLATAGKAAHRVAAVQGAPESRRHSASLAPDGQRPAVPF
jgi:hypothetical protein